MSVSVPASARLGRDVRLEAGDGGRIVLGEDCSLGDGCRVLARSGTVTIGDGVAMGERCTLLAHAEIAVGDGVRFGDGVLVVDFDHGTGDVERPVRLQPLELAPVAVGDGAVLGHGACVLRGVAIGAGAVVGAHAVVTRDVAAGASVGGVPARAGGEPPPR